MTDPKNIADVLGGAEKAQILVEDTRVTVAETNRVIQETRKRIAHTRAHNQELVQLTQTLDEMGKPDEGSRP